ncbi:LOW QUALITY PROTEIN: E3 ubiquitin-protein ligase TRIM7-like [Vombatus ursinus]|uniref:LOW QUALITY PROTEIN: E3 ubiquitin-protein ligase TRIM7-like n=1 Tax=Vombatus ursinus TaxID=29139 RepID=UPI000FFD1311|nr:LOW QUALITY PROTEIN: E3 ubiquitin-protein ligase TRIM7-like [Vombatus ursinus]
MATSDPVRLLQEEVTCAICLDYLHEPVTIDCGHNFCRACITRCWDEMGRRFPCPQCRARSPKRKLRPNCQLANVATAAKRLRPNAGEDRVPGPGTSVGKGWGAREPEAQLATSLAEEEAKGSRNEQTPKAPEDKSREAQDGETQTGRLPDAARDVEGGEPGKGTKNEAEGPVEAPDGGPQRNTSPSEEGRDSRTERRLKDHREGPAHGMRQPPEAAAPEEAPGREMEKKAEGAPSVKAGKGPREQEDVGQVAGAGNSLAAGPGDRGQWAEPRPGMSLPQSPCPQHPGEDLWLFCRRDGATLCPACHHERAHRGHDLVVLDEEGQATRARLRGVLGSLRAQRKALEDAGTRQELQGAHLDEEAAIRRQRLGDEFEGLRHFLSKAEQDLLSSLALLSTRPRPPAEPEEPDSRPMPSNWTALLEASAWLHLPSARLLGDSGVQEGLRKLEAEAGKTLGTRVIPGEGLGRAGRAQAVLKEAARAFRERLSGELDRDEPPVRFDANSAAPGLEVSESGRIVRLVPRASAQQADLCPCVLGDKTWRDGSHYWEVDVSGSGGWAVGVACEGNPRPQPNKGLWALQLSRGQLWTPEVTLAIRQQPQRLAVYLEVEAGLLAFSDAQSGAPVHSYQGAEWGPVATLRPCFWLWDLGGSLRLSP